MKKISSALIALVMFIAMAGLALAVTITITTTQPTAEQALTTNGFDVNISLSTNASTCRTHFGYNATVPTPSPSYYTVDYVFAMTNDSLINTTFYYQNTSTPDGYYFSTVTCNDTFTPGNVSWSNYSMLDRRYFTVFSNATINASTWSTVPNNVTNFSAGWIWLNITTDRAAQNVSVNFSAGSAHSQVIQYLSNTSVLPATGWFLNATGYNATQTKVNDTINFAANNTWYAAKLRDITGINGVSNLTNAGLGTGNFTFNATHILMQSDGKLAVGIYNITYTYRDTWSAGQKTAKIFINNSGYNKAQQWSYNRDFLTDVTVPAVANQSSGYTTSGSLNVTFQATDTNLEKCSVRIYPTQISSWGVKEANTTGFYNNTPGGPSNWCTFLMNTSWVNMTEGEFIVEPAAFDFSGNRNVSVNQSNWVLNKVISGWNLMGSLANETQQAFGSRGEFISRVVLQNNSDGNSYSYLVGTSANQNTSLNYSVGFWVFANASRDLYRKNEMVGAIRNVTIISGGYNFIGIVNRTAAPTIYQMMKYPLNNLTIVPKYAMIYNTSDSNPYYGYRLDINVSTLGYYDKTLYTGQGWAMATNNSIGVANASVRGSDPGPLESIQFNATLIRQRSV